MVFLDSQQPTSIIYTKSIGSKTICITRDDSLSHIIISKAVQLIGAFLDPAHSLDSPESNRREFHQQPHLFAAFKLEIFKLFIRKMASSPYGFWMILWKYRPQRREIPSPPEIQAAERLESDHESEEEEEECEYSDDDESGEFGDERDECGDDSDYESYDSNDASLDFITHQDPLLLIENTLQKQIFPSSPNLSPPSPLPSSSSSTISSTESEFKIDIFAQFPINMAIGFSGFILLIWIISYIYCWLNRQKRRNAAK